MNIAIIDDDVIQQKTLKIIIIEWFKQHNIQPNISIYNSAESFLFHIEDKMVYDILLLDVEMNGMDGIELAKNIRDKDKNVAIIFITGYKEYVFESFHVQAIDYILKPINKEKIDYALTKAYENTKKDESMIFDTVDDYQIKVNLRDILYIESSGHYTILYTSEKQLKVRVGINNIEDDLKNYGYFYRCHRSFLVNILSIDYMSKTEVHMLNSTVVPIARGKWEKLNMKYLDYYRRNINDRQNN